jgi:hypothetical protein
MVEETRGKMFEDFPIKAHVGAAPFSKAPDFRRFVVVQVKFN